MSNQLPAFLRPFCAAAFGLGLVSGTAFAAGPPAKNDKMVSFQQDQTGINVLLGDIPAPKVMPEAHGVNLRFPGKVAIDLEGLRHLPSVHWANAKTEHGFTLVFVRSQAGTRLYGALSGNHLLLTADQSAAEAKPAGKTDQTADSQAAARKDGATKEGAIKDGGKDGTNTAVAAKGSHDLTKADLDALRQSVAGKLALLNNTPSPNGGAAPANESATAGLAQAGGPAAGTASVSVPPLSGNNFAVVGAPGAAVAAAPGPLRPSCPALPFAAWKGDLPFPDQNSILRANLAHHPDDLTSLAALAEFYVANGMANEALDLLSGWSDDEPNAPARQRILQVRDVARLLNSEPIESSSPLLTSPPNCEHAESGVWNGLEAAATNDPHGVIVNAQRAREALTNIPEPLRTMFAVRMADGAQDNRAALRLMVAALRDSSGGTKGDQADRWLLHARLAQAEQNSNDEFLYLQKAAEQYHTVAGLISTMRLAGMQIRRTGESGAHAEKVLTDIARTYRHDMLGEQAALMLAKQDLANGDFAGALDMADSAAQADSKTTDSGAARFAAKALRLLIVDSKGTALPPATDQMAMFWRYENYTPPGEFGDDIRMAATQLLLNEGFADAALDVARQFAPVTLAKPEGAILRARAEATAESGDANAAIAMTQKLPSTAETQMITSAALSRLGRKVDAAQAIAQLDSSLARQRRANLLFSASAWPQAANAYAEVLRDPGTSREAREDATRRYSLAVALSHAMPANPPANDLLASDDESTKLLAVAVPAVAPPNAPPVATVREEIARSEKIETLLPADAASLEATTKSATAESGAAPVSTP